jgi:DNA-binding response OmpR family regulator
MSSAEKPTPSPDEQQALEKSEVMLVDKDEKVREGLSKMLTSSGIIVTAIGDLSRALLLAREKHFATILLDLDTPEQEQGIKLVGKFQAASPASSVVLMSGRQTFDVAVRGFRAGAADVVAKSAGDVKYLNDRVTSLCLESRRADKRELLLREALAIHEQFLKRLMDANRKVQSAEDRASGRSTSLSTECAILVVDDNPRTAPGLQEALGGPPYNCICALNGGEALDYAGGSGFQIALVKESLPDLSGTMVSKSLQAQSNDGIVLIFDHPGSEPGYASIVERTQTIPLLPRLTAPSQLVDVLKELREAYAAKAREKRYLQSFRQEHLDFLKRYVEFRKQLVALLPGQES